MSEFGEVGRDILASPPGKSKGREFGESKALTQILKTSLTRRELLKIGGVGALVAAAADMGIKAWELRDIQGALAENPPNPKTAPPEIEKTAGIIKEGRVTDETEPARKEGIPPPKPDAFELIFGNLSAFEKEEARRRVSEQIKHYQKDPGLQERIINSRKWQPEVTQSAQNLGFKPDSFVPPLLPALIFVESSGNPKADSGIAKGLCQLRWSTAKASANRLGTPLNSGEDLFDPKLNITLALESLHYLYQRFPDRGLALWSYHLGETNLARAMGAYTISQGNKAEEIYNILNDPKQIGTANLTKNPKYGEPNFVKLINSQRVTSQLKEDHAFGDDTEFYVPRIVAAAELLAQAK